MVATLVIQIAQHSIGGFHRGPVLGGNLQAVEHPGDGLWRSPGLAIRCYCSQELIDELIENFPTSPTADAGNLQLDSEEFRSVGGVDHHIASGSEDALLGGIPPHRIAQVDGNVEATGSLGSEWALLRGGRSSGPGSRQPDGGRPRTRWW